MLQDDDLLSSPSNLLELIFSYDGTTGTISLTASSGNYMFMLDALKERLEPALGIEIPTTSSPASDVPTLSVSATIGLQTGLRDLAVYVEGGSIFNLAARLGVPWPLQPDALAIHNPVVKYIANPLALEVDLMLDIPALSIRGASASLQIATGPRLVIQVRRSAKLHVPSCDPLLAWYTGD